MATMDGHQEMQRPEGYPSDEQGLPDMSSIVVSDMDSSWVLCEVKLNQVKVKTMQRSLSLGSPLTPSKKGDESPLRLERFKIRTVNIGDIQGGQEDGQGGQGANKPAGSK